MCAKDSHWCQWEIFSLTYSQNQLLWWQKSVGVPITCGFIQWGAEGALLPSSPIKLFADESTQHFSEASRDVPDWAPQDSCLWALTMQSWAEMVFFFFILIVYLQNRFQQLKSICGLMEKAAVGGFLALKEWKTHQWQREESVDYAPEAGQGAQGRQRRLTEVFAECSSKEPGGASKLPGSGGQTLYFNFVQRIDSERHQMTAAVCTVISRV